MSNLANKNMAIFGSSSGINEISQFGSLAAGSPVFSTDPNVIQSLSNYLSGWYGAIIGNNSPAIEDMNAIFYLITYQLAYLMQKGIPEWNSTMIYYKGSMVNSGGIIYVSITDSNLNNALTDSSNWKFQGGGVTSVSTTYSALDTDEVIIGDTTSAGFTVTLRPVANSKGKRLKIKNIGANTLTVKGNASELIDGANSRTDMNYQWAAMEVCCDGSVWYII